MAAKKTTKKQDEKKQGTELEQQGKAEKEKAPESTSEYSKQVQVVYSGRVRIHSQPVLGNNAVTATAKPGEVLNAVELVKDESGNEFYKLDSGDYITADTKLVK